LQIKSWIEREGKSRKEYDEYHYIVNYMMGMAEYHLGNYQNSKEYLLKNLKF
jgi:hypothetical protein